MKNTDVLFNNKVTSNDPVSRKANRDRNKLGAWLDSDRIYEYVIVIPWVVRMYVEIIHEL